MYVRQVVAESVEVVLRAVDQRTHSHDREYTDSRAEVGPRPDSLDATDGSAAERDFSPTSLRHLAEQVLDLGFELLDLGVDLGERAGRDVP